MQRINYKMVSLVLALILVVTYAMDWQDIFNHKSEVSKNPKIKNSSHMMENMHMMPNGEMMMSGNDAGMDLGHNNGNDSAMKNMMQDMMSGLNSKTGDEFDKAFLNEMVTHHAGAVEMAKEVIKKSKRPELIKLANDIITAQEKEIKMMEGWSKEWFK